MAPLLRVKTRLQNHLQRYSKQARNAPAVLMVTGLLVLYAKHWLPDGQKAASHAVFRYLPVVSAAIIVGIGVAMTWVSLRRP
jgi:ABC-type nickel/cobalt efflux system permease component RcnA